MAGQLLGLGADEISMLMAQIEAFADIGEYIDQPVRVYSSGMQMRLAFSVAVARRPDVLIVDEALAVGDAYFQQKCFDRIREFSREGTTLLIVSHDKQAIQSICSRAILLNGGRVAMEGDPEAVMDYYNALLVDTRNETIHREPLPEGKTRTISGSRETEVCEIALLDEQDRQVHVVEVGARVTLKVVVQANAPVERLVLGYAIRDRLGQFMYGTNTELTRQPIEQVLPGTRMEYRITFVANLGVGGYSIVTALVADGGRLDGRYEWRDRALMFEVVNSSKAGFAGCVWMEPQIVISTP
jgi:lipopolysaccharide transport system ATP-binding protein